MRADCDERSFHDGKRRWSDLILPAASVLESNNVTMGWCNDDYLLSNSRAVEPLFGTMPDYDWVCMIADAMGLRRGVPRRTRDDRGLDLRSLQHLPPDEGDGASAL